MGKIATRLIDLIGKTPLMELSNYNSINNIEARLIAKLEYFNPLGSVKDRVGCALIADAEKKGILKHDSVIIEATSGNFGVSLAFAATLGGYKLILTMPETMSLERRNLLKALGAKLVLTDGAKGMKGAIEKAEELHKETPNSVILGQFINPANPDIHRRTTALEIWNDTDGKVDIFVGGVGTGGTITGVGEVLKQKNANVKIVAVEPSDSAVLSGGAPGAHNIQGIGAGFIPEIMNIGVVDEIIRVTGDQAVHVVRGLAIAEGLLVGISSGAALYAATEVAKRPENKGKMIIVILPDTGERYLSTDLFGSSTLRTQSCNK